VSGPTESAELNRIAFFSDGVFAIAITLLVVPLLDLGLEPGQTLGDALLERTPEVGSYALSFAVSGLYWMGQHRMFREVWRYDHGLILLNLLLLGLIAFLPYLALRAATPPVVFALSIPLALVSARVAEVSWAAVFVVLLLHERWYRSPGGAFG
jgi:uncharacterized membrane protein